jgi:hypothetical protein
MKKKNFLGGFKSGFLLFRTKHFKSDRKLEPFGVVQYTVRFFRQIKAKFTHYRLDMGKSEFVDPDPVLQGLICSTDL